MPAREKPQKRLYFKCKTLSLIHILGKRWTIDVMEILSSERKAQFNYMLKRLNGVTPRALSNILSDLSMAQVIQKVETKKHGAVHTSYSLTDKGRIFEDFIRSSKQLGVDLYSIDAGCVNRNCRECELNTLTSKSG